MKIGNILPQPNWINTDSEVIKILRFPLIFVIILFHARYQSVNFSDAGISLKDVQLFDNVTFFFESIGHVGVPLFFFISGYLFFYKIDKFGWNVYKNKIIKRLKTLCIPYFIWNTYSLLLLLFSTIIFPHYLSGRHDLFVHFNVPELCRYYYAIDGNNPINGPLWFIRDLMVVCLLSPMIYFCIKRFSFLYLSALGFLWLFKIWNLSICGVYGFSSCSFLFFSLGAFLVFMGKHSHCYSINIVT